MQNRIHIFTEDYVKITHWSNINEVPNDYAKNSFTSKVLINGKPVYKPEICKARDIRNAFNLNYIKNLQNYFTGFKIGVGTKYIYFTGDFIKEKLDDNLGKLSTLTHVANLRIIQDVAYSGGEIKIADNTYTHVKGKNLCILTGLNVQIDNLPVLSGVKHVYVFPIYGVYNLNDNYLKTHQIHEVIPCRFTYVLEQLRKFLANKLSEFPPNLYDIVVALHDTTCSNLINKIKNTFSLTWNLKDVYYADFDSNTSFACVNYTLNGETYTQIINGYNTLIDPAATNISVDTVSGVARLYYELEKRIKYMIETANDYQLSMPEALYIKELSRMDLTHIQTMLEKDSCLIYLTGNYDSTTTINDLNPIDKCFLRVLTNKFTNCEILFCPNITVNEDNAYQFNYQTHTIDKKITYFNKNISFKDEIIYIGSALRLIKYN